MTPFSMHLDAEQREQLSSSATLILVSGIVSMALGIIIIVWPKSGAFAFAVLIAIALVLTGITEIALSKTWQQRWVPVAFGSLAIAAGLATVVWPEVTLKVLAVLIGISFLLRGIVRVVGALMTKQAYWGLVAIVGAIEALLGIAAIAWPKATILVLAVLLGINLLISGIAQVAFAQQVKKLSASPA